MSHSPTNSSSSCELHYPDVWEFVARNEYRPSFNSSTWLATRINCNPEFVYMYKIKSTCFVVAYTLLLVMFAKNFMIRLIRYALPPSHDLNSSSL